MADEALAGLDEGALRKLVSGPGPITPNVRKGKPGQSRTFQATSQLLRVGGGGGERRGAGGEQG